MSLLAAAAVPVGTLAACNLHAATPVTVRGSGTTTVVVSESALTSISSGAGGLIVEGRERERKEIIARQGKLKESSRGKK